MPPNEPPRPRQPSRPDLQAAAEKDRTVAGADRQRRFDEPKRTTLTDLPAAHPADRKPTFTGLPAPPPLPLEHAVTKPAPPALPFRKTMRVDSPAGLLAAARRSDPPAASDPPPVSGRVPADETVPSARQRDREALLLQALNDERAKTARLERDARAAGEARIQSFPPKVEQRSVTPVPSSAPNKVDEATGKLVRHLLRRFWPLLLGAAGLGAGGAGALKPAADPVKTDAMAANLEAMRADVSVMRDQLTSVLKWQSAQGPYTKCLEEALDEIGSQVLPAQDRAGAAQPLRAYVSRCQRLRP